MRRRALLLSLSSFVLLFLCVLARPVAAISTRSFVLDDMTGLAAGELVHVAAFSDGHVETSVDLRRLALPDDVTIAWSAVRASDGTIYLGTGDTGRIYRVSADAVTLFAETGQLLVSALALGEGGVLYAGTLPEGRIYAVETTGATAGTIRELVRPADADGSHAAEHVWALTYDTSRHLLFAATGPEGRVYAIDRSGSASVYWDSTADHVMSLVLDGSALYAGTSDDAIVVRLTAPGTAEAIGDFPGNEITALAFRDGRLVVGANEFPDPPAVAASATTKRSATTASPARPRPGKARVFTVEAGGRAERVWGQDEGHVTRLEIAADGTIYAATGEGGRIVRIASDRTSAVWVDVDERQVLAIGLTEPDPYFVTSDGPALYRALPGRPRTASWTSKVLDAEFDARWGALEWRGTGTLRFSTRSGGTERPDETWSDWSTESTTSGPIRSPANRFLQIRASFDGDPDAVLRAVTAYYLGENQRGVVSEVGLKVRAPAKRTPDVDPYAPPAPSPMLGLTWKIDNPDADRMRFRIRYREESQAVWRAILEESETLSSLEYTWDTTAVPDGWYVVEVEGSDELSNPSDLVLRSTSASEPLLVDNHAPTVTLRAAGTTVAGSAEDAIGPISRLELAVDGGEWRLFFPEDDLFDTRRESFEEDLSSLAAGSHIVAVRAYDAGGNQASAETTITIAAPSGSGGARAAGGRRRAP